MWPSMMDENTRRMVEVRARLEKEKNNKKHKQINQ
jgi:hypothetical protein